MSVFLLNIKMRQKKGKARALIKNICEREKYQIPDQLEIYLFQFKSPNINCKTI